MAVNTRPGDALRSDIQTRGILPLIGVYDVFSASIAARHFDGIFISGFSFAASHYGLPDTGFISWSDIVDFTQRVRTILPRHHIIVDIDDGYCDPEVACHVVSLLENMGASGIILEDQLRPRRCGHLDGKELMALDDYLDKLERVLERRNHMYVIARTDAIDEAEALHRARAIAATDADAILVEAVRDLEFVKKLSKETGRPIAFNQIAGGKSPPATLTDLQAAGVSIVNYSTPCLFAAREAVNTAMLELKQNDGLLAAPQSTDNSVQGCTDLLKENLHFREKS
jgi:2-methylisocitrate lyase-like PEP mutase family enzyme